MASPLVNVVGRPLVNVGIQTAKYCNVAGLGVLIFDYFLTLEHEVRWTWNRGWSFSRVLFVISRYMPFPAAAMTAYAAIAPRINENCAPFGRGSNALHITSIVAAEGLLIIRTYAFWKRSKKLLILLVVLAAICLALAVSITQVVDKITTPATPSTAHPCTFQTGRSSAIQYGFLIAYELLLISLTVYKRYKDYRDSNSRIVNVVFQGAVLYMTAIIFVSVVNIVITVAVPISYDEMMDVPQLVLHSMLASRVLFNLHRSNHEETEETLVPLSTFHPAYVQLD